jgi:hypothetical protein
MCLIFVSWRSWKAADVSQPKSKYPGNRSRIVGVLNGSISTVSINFTQNPKTQNEGVLMKSNNSVKWMSLLQKEANLPFF